MPVPITHFSVDTSIFNATLYDRLRDLWFLDLSLPASAPSQSQMARWFGVGASPAESAAFDTQCQEHALRALLSLGPDKLSLPPCTDVDSDQATYPVIATPFTKLFSGGGDIEKHASNALGMVLLLDQMTRNCFRDDQSVIYSHYDRIARAISHEIYARRLDKTDRFRNSPPWRVWFYLPMMHSEAKEDHERLLQNVEEMRAHAQSQDDEAAMKYLDHTLLFEKRHYDVLVKLGRYPHRNKVLGRQSTAQEKEYLEAGGDTFGT